MNTQPHDDDVAWPDDAVEVAITFAKAAKLLDMEVLDHVIIGDGIYVSLHERGVI